MSRSVVLRSSRNHAAAPRFSLKTSFPFVNLFRSQTGGVRWASSDENLQKVRDVFSNAHDSGIYAWVSFSVDRNLLAKEHGFTLKQLDTLWQVIMKRCVGKRWGPPAVAEIIKERKNWLAHDRAMSAQGHIHHGRRNILLMIEKDRENGLDWADIGEHGTRETASLLTAAARITLRTEAFTPAHVRICCFALEVAVEFGNVEAAAWLYVLADDPIIGEYLKRAKRTAQMPEPSLQRATVLLKNETRLSNCPWQAVVAFLDRQTKRSSLPRKNDDELANAMALLERAAAAIVPGYAAGNSSEYHCFENPSKLMLRIIDYCRSTGRKPRGYTDDTLDQAYGQCLRTLLQYDDPDARFATVLQPDLGASNWLDSMKRDFGTSNWLESMTCAATAANPDACWLLALYYWQEEGLIDLGAKASSSQTRAPTSFFGLVRGQQANLSWHYATRCLTFMDLTQENTRSFINRATSAAAIARLSGQFAEGSAILDHASDRFNTKPGSADTLKQREAKDQLENTMKEYQIKDPSQMKYWDTERCKQAIAEDVILDNAFKAARSRLKSLFV